jgi:hypothetical protein
MEVTAFYETSVSFIKLHGVKPQEAAFFVVVAMIT